MNSRLSSWLARSLLLAVPTLASAQAIRVDLDATGAAGPIDVMSGTVTYTLPESGIIQASSVHVAAGATLKFTHNTRNTGVVILSAGDVTIDGTITVSGEDGTNGGAGQGGPGGYAGGIPTVAGGDIRFSPRVPAWAQRFDEPWLSGAPGGVGSSAAGCVTPGSGGGGGSGFIWILSETAIHGSATGSVRALGGGNTTRLPTGGACGVNGSGNPAAPGFDGNIRLMAPTLDAGPLVLRGALVRLDRLFTTQDPTATDRSGTLTAIQVSETLSKLPSFNPSVTVVSVDGQPVPAGETNVLTINNGPFKQAVARVTGCAGAEVFVYLVVSTYSSMSGGMLTQATTSAQVTSAGDPEDVSFEFGAVGPVSGYVEAYAVCR